MKQHTTGDEVSCVCDTSTNINASVPLTDAIYSTVKGALLGTRFSSFDELKSVIQIKYVNDNDDTDSTIHGNSKVYIKHCSDGMEVISVLESGISQGDIAEAKDGDFFDRLGIIFHSPYAVSNRKDLESVFLLARVRPNLFGEGDVAFFNLAQTMVRNINTTDIAFKNPKDSTEKGYLNTFNHMTAQAFITSCFSEELADFVGDTHERYHHPELILGKFSAKEINDLAEGPVDNYVDIINNEWGQEVGKQLAKKYSINRKTYWTPELMADYLNDLQDYYSWAFQIGFKPFRPEDEQVIKFSRKINAVINSK
ncbi:MAG: hypothetical protein IPO83_04425 [Chitinophagaceae bacterium]|nr:hypothetical protein [Chitinophagaceae bacterium]